jgi:phosphoribosylformylglycinamidine cyclo-ligase
MILEKRFERKNTMDYKNAGVDIEAGYKAVELMKKHVAKTMRPEVLGGLGGFSGAFAMNSFMKMKNPTLLSGTDGVGTKLKLAFLLDKHDTIGIDCVAMCVNDVACAGGEPLFFLDYIACGKNTPEKIADIVGGVATGCEMAGAALIGGETAEMPGFYPEDEYDLAGFAVGIVDKDEMITGENLKKGDVLVGIASSGIHSNGYSLVRKVFPMERTALDRYSDDLGETLGTALLRPTKIYVKALKSIKDAGVTVKACSHITGGGFYENIPRMLKAGTRAVIEKNSYEVPPIFKLLAKTGNIEEKMMYNTYNMGIGMCLAVDKNDVDKTVAAIKAAGENAYVLGFIDNGEKDICLK